MRRGLVAELAAQVADADLRVAQALAGLDERRLRGKLVGREQLGAAAQQHRIGADRLVRERLDHGAAFAQAAFDLGHERVEPAPVAGHRLRVERACRSRTDRPASSACTRSNASGRLVVALELQQRVAAVADDARDVRRDGEHGVEVVDRVARSGAVRTTRCRAGCARPGACGVDVQAAREREHGVLGAAQREQRAAAALVRGGVLRVDAQRGVEVGQRRGRLLQREARGAAADDRLQVLGHQHDGAVVAGERVVLAAEILQHAGAVVVGLRDVGRARR